MKNTESRGTVQTPRAAASAPVARRALLAADRIAWHHSPRMTAQRRLLETTTGWMPSAAVPVQRALRVNLLKGKVSGGLVEQGRTAEFKDDTPATLWVNMQPETQANAHSTVWFSCEIEGATVLVKMDWVDKGFRAIYRAGRDAYYCAPVNAKHTTVGAIVDAARQHIAQLGEKRATLEGHCHAFALSVFDKVPG